MSIWYNSKKQEYASDGKNGWIKAYCDKAITEIKELLSNHFAGNCGRHKASDVDYNSNMTVKQKIDDFHQTFIDISDDIYNVIEDEKKDRKNSNAILQTNIDNETTARKSADAALDAKIGDPEDIGFESTYSSIVNAINGLYNLLSSDISTKADKITNNGFLAGGAAKNNQYGIAVGSNAAAEQSSVAIGYNAQANEWDSVAIGIGAKTTATDSIQIGSGTNSKEFTTKLMNYQLTEYDDKGEITYLSDVGKLNDLITQNKASLVGAVNEMFNKINWHINGEADRHTADNVDYNSTLTVQDFLENLDNATTDLNEAFGTKSNLATTDKTSLVGAVNEVFNSINTHINGEADRHTADNVDYNSTLTVQDYLENLDNATTDLNEAFGTKSELATTDKASLVGAVNEVFNSINTHINGEAGRHTADNVDYNSTLTVQDYLENLDNATTRTDEILDTKANKKTATNGFVGGNNAEETGGGAALGNYSKTVSGGAVGSEAESKNGFAGGYNAKCTGQGANIGSNSHAYHGGAVGNSAQAGNGFAGGNNAKCGTASNGADIDCIQLGEGTNGTEKTMQVYNKRIVEADGSLTDVGILNNLATADKSSIVNAINELYSLITN